jgi:exosortase A-associated hydrolase 2
VNGASVSTEPLWVGQGRDRRFAILFEPRAVTRGALVFVHAFGEEMNKSRRMVACASRALAERGWIVLATDLLGCGDSPSDIGEAQWLTWRDDVARAHAWLEHRARVRPALWGMRAGALLAAAAADLLTDLPLLLFWQPVSSGKTHLNQFLRLKVAAGALTGGTKTTIAELTAALAAGQTLNVAGYAISPQLALPMSAAELKAPPHVPRVVWLEVAEAGLPPASQRVVEAWRSAGTQVDAETVQGPAFWQTQEIEECPLLIEHTLRALEPLDAA